MTDNPVPTGKRAACRACEMQHILVLTRHGNAVKPRGTHVTDTGARIELYEGFGATENVSVLTDSFTDASRGRSQVLRTEPRIGDFVGHRLLHRERALIQWRR
ncbi:hypothetical protein GCM10009784_11060 [Arthrobacter parietis]|uniref:Uncharacterized protein n=1 Tax=Arthrobacter parietis TaxID=271434 RepID=A0ABN3ASI4_9MICC